MLDRVHFESQSFDIVRNGVVVARIVPPVRERSTIGDLLAALETVEPTDVDFPDDLETIKREQPPVDDDPWTS